HDLRRRIRRAAHVPAPCKLVRDEAGRLRPVPVRHPAHRGLLAVTRAALRRGRPLPVTGRRARLPARLGGERAQKRDPRLARPVPGRTVGRIIHLHHCVRPAQQRHLTKRSRAAFRCPRALKRHGCFERQESGVMAASLPHPGHPQDTASWRLTPPPGLTGGVKGWLRRRRYRSRLVAGMLAVILPLMLGFAAILTAGASTSLRASSERKGVGVARAVTLRLEDWLGERRSDLKNIADQASAGLADPLTASLVDDVDKTSGDFTVIEVTDLAGRVLASSHPERSFDPSGQGTFRAAASGQPVLDTVVAVDGHLRWNLEQPVLDGTGRPQGVVVGDLNPTVLATL